MRNLVSLPRPPAYASPPCTSILIALIIEMCEVVLKSVQGFA